MLSLHVVGHLVTERCPISIIYYMFANFTLVVQLSFYS